MATQEYARTLNKFKKEADLLEKEKQRNFYSSKMLAEEIAELDSLEKSLKSQRCSNSYSFFQSIERIKRIVQEVSYKIKGFIEKTNAEGAYIDYESMVQILQKAADSVDAELKEFKAANRIDFENLAQEEKALSTEIDQLAEKFEQWENEPSQTIISKPTKTLIEGIDAPPMLQEVMAIDKQIIDMGGNSLGWDEADHQEFMKLRTQHKGKQTIGFFQAAQNLLPTMDQESIKIHCKKYEEWIKLNEKKKEILAKWREEKKKRKESQTKLIDIEPAKPKPVKRPQSAFETQKKIEEWRRQRDLLRTEKEKEEKSQFQRKKEEEEKRKMETEIKKQLVNEYKERKEIEKAQQYMIQNYQKKRNTVELSEEDKIRLKEREDKLTKKKQEKLLEEQKKKEEKERREMMIKMKTNAQWSHLDSRLNQETVATVTRKEAQRAEVHADTFGGVLIHRPGRAIPSWRAGISS
ncbi:unnamed protein product [Blepharisma stoltei]|uniref:Uncharacterized protein n=1 Tax=Blepharisma stoltei TaxID=1481888 RepID=A0AAU9J0R8_9CILI|nr:unnamed protein product [Blepharisma stoltei]